MRPIIELLKSYTSPFYYFDKKGFVENYKELEDTFAAVYADYKISYSYKTNYTPNVCELVKRLGGLAEVVSDMEYLLAKKIGCKDCEIVYNGPAKGPLMEDHLLHGGIVNIDNSTELSRILAFANRHPSHQFKVGLRINLDVGGSFISRFGFVFNSVDIENAVARINNFPNVDLVGLHCHISRARGIEAWKQRSRIMLEAADRYIATTPEYISLGSGMFGQMSEELRSQFGNDVPSYKDYADAVLTPFAERYALTEKKPIVFTEPGTTLISRFIYFVTRITDIKNIRGRNIATTDGSYQNIGEICELKKLPLTVISGGGRKIKYDAVDIVGYTCLEQDVMCKDLSAELAIGDILIFENAGGYSIVSKPQFIRPNCPMYTTGKSGKTVTIMRAETFDDVFSKFIFNADDNE